MILKACDSHVREHCRAMPSKHHCSVHFVGRCPTIINVHCSISHPDHFRIFVFSEHGTHERLAGQTCMSECLPGVIIRSTRPRHDFGGMRQPCWRRLQGDAQQTRLLSAFRRAMPNDHEYERRAVQICLTKCVTRCPTIMNVHCRSSTPAAVSQSLSFPSILLTSVAQLKTVCQSVYLAL